MKYVWCHSLHFTPTVRNSELFCTVYILLHTVCELKFLFQRIYTIQIEFVLWMHWNFLLLLLAYCDMYIFLSFNDTTTMSMHRSCKRSNHWITLQFPMEYFAWVLAVMISFLMWNFRANIGTLYLLSININHFVHIPTCDWFFFLANRYSLVDIQ